MLCYMQMIETEEDCSKFEQVYLMYRGLMFHVAMNILHNESDAEDAVHQAFISIIENIHRVSDPNCPKTRAYAVIIAERKAIDIYRQRATDNTVSFDEANCGMEIEPPGDHGLADSMARLPTRYREVLLLHYYNGFSVREIAKAMGMKKGTVQKMIWRAKTALQKEMEGGGGNEEADFKS